MFTQTHLQSSALSLSLQLMPEVESYAISQLFIILSRIIALWEWLLSGPLPYGVLSPIVREERLWGMGIQFNHNQVPPHGGISVLPQ